MCYVMEETSVDEDIPSIWDIKRLTGERLTHVATFSIKSEALAFLKAKNWYDTRMEVGLFSLPEPPKPRAKPKPLARKTTVRKRS